jgi:hypothetical protein
LLTSRANNKAKSDEIILIIAIIMLLLSSYMLLFGQALLISGLDSGNIDIALLGKKEDVVRAKPVSFLTWQNIPVQTKFYPEDQVFAGEKSYADIAMNSGEQISLTSNTLIRLSDDLFQKGINLDYGNISINGGTSGKKINLPNGQTVFAESEKSNLTMSKSGELEISGAGIFAIDGKKMVIGEDEYLVLANNEMIKKSYISKLKTPSDKSDIPLDSTQATGFSWENIVQEYGDTRVLQISRDYEFSDLIAPNPLKTKDRKGTLFSIPHFRG